jgi:hypothetical protein
LGTLRLRWEHWLLIAAVAAHLAMMGSLFWGYFDTLVHGPDVHLQAVDFFSIYEGGARALRNETLYCQGWVCPSVETPYSVAYRYVPMFAYLFAVPANLLPPWNAYWAWIAFNELLLLANAYVTWRVAGRGPWAVVAAAMWFVFTPFYFHQYVGQFSMLMATAGLWVAIGFLREREAIAAPPWLVSIVTKSYSAVLAPVFLRYGWWRSLAGAATLVALNLLYFAFKPSDWDGFYKVNVSSFYSETADRITRFHPGDLGAISLVRNSYLAFDTGATDVPTAVAVLVAFAVVAYSVQATFLISKADPLVLIGIWTCVPFLVLGAWEFDYLLMLPVLALMVATRPAMRPVALVVFVLLALPTPYWLLNNVFNSEPIPGATGREFSQEYWPAWGIIWYHACKAVPVIFLWGYLSVSQLREGFELHLPSFSRARTPAGDVE